MRTAKALDSCIHALGAAPQPSAAQIRSRRICRGELTAQWRADQFIGNKLAQLKAARRGNYRDGSHEYLELISGDNSAEALLAKIQEEREALKKTAKPKKTPKKKATVKKATAKKSTAK